MMTVVAIVGVLAAIALPTYLNYQQAARVAAAALGIDAYKQKVGQCIQDIGTNLGCTHSTFPAIPPDIASGDGGATISYVDQVIVVDGLINVVTTAVNPSNVKLGLTFEPEFLAGNAAVNWRVSGTGCTTVGRSIRCDR